MKSLVENIRAAPFKEPSLQRFIERLQEALEGRVEEAYLFGSLAEGTWDRDSDVDLILIVDTDIPFTQRAEAFFDLYELSPRIDLLVYTPNEFEQLKRQKSPGFWTSALGQLRKVV